MEYTKKQIKYNWEKNIEDFTDKLQYPYSENNQSDLAKRLSSLPEETVDKTSPLTSYSEVTDYNAPIGQEYDDYQYSYEEGYFKAFKLTLAGSGNDSESFLMPALFLARHYIELSLKDEITNVSIATGTSFKVGNKDNHCLTDLSISFKKLLEENSLNILHSKFFDIVQAIDSLSPKSDEFRYTTDLSGKYNLPIAFTDDNKLPKVINLIVLGQYINYIYLHLYSLYFILEDNEESLLTDTIFENPYVKGLLYGIVHSNISKTLNESSEDQIASKIKNCISSIISNNNLTIDSSNIKVDRYDDGYQVLLNSSELFILFKNDRSWFLKTRPLIRWIQS